jgi:ornithine cyclodeaminase
LFKDSYMNIIKLDQIKEIMKSIQLIPAIEKSFVAYSQGKAILAPVGELNFQKPRGEVHLKYGYMLDDEYYLIKIASSFYENPKLNLPSGNGLMLIFSQKTGAILGILLDEGYLTDLRTAAAGAIAAKYFAPSKITGIGILGTGTQAKLQLSYLREVTRCRSALVWGRSLESLNRFQTEMAKEGFSLQVTQDLEAVTSTCNLIVTTTPSETPLLFAHQIKKGTHITAVGTDSPHKQELDSPIFTKADLVVADSIEQCLERGDLAHAIRGKVISRDKVLELGKVISGLSPRRSSDEQISLVDLTGLAVQDIEIAKTVYERSYNIDKVALKEQSSIKGFL